MRDKPFSFNALGDSLKQAALTRDDRDRFWASGRSLTFDPIFTANSVEYPGGEYGYYVQQNDLVTFWFMTESIQVPSSAGQWSIRLPVPASVRSGDKTQVPIADVTIRIGASNWRGRGYVGGGGAPITGVTDMGILAQTAISTEQGLTQAIPGNWVTTPGFISGWGNYEAASGFTRED